MHPFGVQGEATERRREAVKGTRSGKGPEPEGALQLGAPASGVVPGRQQGLRTGAVGPQPWGPHTVCAALAGTGTQTFPQTGSGCRRSVWKRPRH